MELNEMNLDELLKDNSNNMVGKLFTNADVDVQISKEEPEQSNEDLYEESKEKAMELLQKYEESDKEIAKLNDEIEELMKPFREANKELFDTIDKINQQIADLKAVEDSISKEILPYQRITYSIDNDYKEMTYNNVHSTYVLPTKKHQFEFKKFLEENADFYENNKTVMSPYAKITDVSDYVKISVKKK